MSEIRHRAETFLNEVLEAVKKEETIDLPVVLAIQKEESSPVWIDCQRRRLSTSERTRWVFVIGASFSWIENATDDEIKAVFSHELGHATLGHCPKVEEEALQAQARRATRKERLFMVSHVCLLPNLALFYALEHTALSRPIAIVLLLHIAFTIFQTVWNMVKVLPEMNESRKDEYAADQFVCRFANPQSLINDLAKCRPTRWSRLIEWVCMPMSTHPSLGHRSRVMGLPVGN